MKIACPAVSVFLITVRFLRFLYVSDVIIHDLVAVGALHALEAHRIPRVAVVDIDAHHGNGTEEIVKAYNKPDRLFFFSIHLFDKVLKLWYELVPHKQCIGPRKFI